MYYTDKTPHVRALLPRALYSLITATQEGVREEPQRLSAELTVPRAGAWPTNDRETRKSGKFAVVPEQFYGLIR